MQHLISKLDAVGMGVVVHNGSTLFSGDAGSPESNIRKWMLDSDIVEAVIQLPTDEFFNTGIYTYLWVLNKNKQTEHKGKVMLTNASEKFKPLKKSKGSKRKKWTKPAAWKLLNPSQSIRTTITPEYLTRSYSISTNRLSCLLMWMNTATVLKRS